MSPLAVESFTTGFISFCSSPTSASQVRGSRLHRSLAERVLHVLPKGQMVVRTALAPSCWQELNDDTAMKYYWFMFRVRGCRIVEFWCVCSSRQLCLLVAGASGNLCGATQWRWGSACGMRRTTASPKHRARGVALGLADRVEQDLQRALRSANS